MFIKILIAVILSVTAGCVSAQQITNVTAERSYTVYSSYVKPCLVNVIPGVWIDWNTVQSVITAKDGTSFQIETNDGKGYNFPVPADQALNYAKRAVAYFEACKR
jgi:hypothetical protein